MPLTIATKSPKRTPRFKPVTPEPFEITQRDLDLLSTAGQLRVLQSTHFDLLFPEASQDKLRRRLKLLFNARLIARPRAQIATMLDRQGSKSMAYVLTRAGAQLLRRHGISVRWRSDDWELGQLQHTLGITDFLVDTTVACRTSAFLEMVPFHELLASAPAQTQGSRIPDQWRVDVHWRGVKETLHLRPDLIFAVRHRGLAEQGKPALKYFFFEKDTGSMPVMRPALAQTSVLRKLLCYGATFRGGLHQSRFGMGNMRLLFLTESAERVAHIIDTYQKHAAHAAPASVFLFTDRQSLAVAPSLFESVWRDGEGKEHTLFG